MKSLVDFYEGRIKLIVLALPSSKEEISRKLIMNANQALAIMLYRTEFKIFSTTSWQPSEAYVRNSMSLSHRQQTLINCPEENATPVMLA